MSGYHSTDETPVKFRWKMQILLLVIALVPLTIIAGLYHISTQKLGNQLAANSQEMLTEKASNFLQCLVSHYGRILSLDKKYLELTLKSQAREVERRLAASPPPPRPLFIDGAPDRSGEFTGNMVLSDRHFRVGPDGQRTPMLVNYQEQVFFLAPRTDQKTVADDINRLASLSEAYQFLYNMNPHFLLWAYTGLESGLFTSFPGVVGISKDFDPRKRTWYQRARQQETLAWGPPYVDVLTRSVLLTLSMPVHRPSGSFAGVVGLDVPMEAMFQELQLPPSWAQHAETFIVVNGEHKGEMALKILAQKSYQNLQQPWQVPIKLDPLEADNPLELAAMINDATEGNPGVRKMSYQGRESLWAYGAVGPGRAFPVIIVPEDFIIAQAADTRKNVLGMTTNVLRIVGIILFGVVATVTITAFFVSRSVTRPVTQISAAAMDLANGNYQTRVQVLTGDELQQLGNVFNEIGPKLLEREQMQRSLALAREVQQLLLPSRSPQIAGFEIFGNSTYCEETGGDYYDFIDSTDLGPGKLGIAVGDVSGHGIGAALLMASARGVLHSQASHQPNNLVALFDSLNLHLAKFSAAEQFMTLRTHNARNRRCCSNWDRRHLGSAQRQR
jgi:sigma-B regulation protein RsbU (phosphoserine phosphatase)